MNDLVVFDSMEDNLLSIQGRKVLIDADVARLYNVETKHVNQAIKNNVERFPAGYVLVLDKSEKMELVKNFDRFNNLKHSTADTLAFTEKGLYMLATILKSPRAVQATISIVETFAKMREITNNFAKFGDNRLPIKERKAAGERGGTMAGELFDAALDNLTETEMTVQINLAMIKLKHSKKTTKPEYREESEEKKEETNGGK